MKDICIGIKHMHSQRPPLAHRDIKAENIMLENKKFKLGDFGSSSSETLSYADNSKQEISKAMEKFEKYTTLMYRPPEMIDEFAKYEVNHQADIWMLGCVLYTLCFAKHPFMEAQKLAIINASYLMPSLEDEIRISEKMRDFIRLLLTPDPKKRPTIFEVLDIISSWNELQNINLSEEVKEIKER